LRIRDQSLGAVDGLDHYYWIYFEALRDSRAWVVPVIVVVPRLQLQTNPLPVSATRAPVANEELLFRQRLRALVLEKYGSLDRFYLETEFSKGHLSQILRGKRSPSLTTLIKLARALNVSVGDFFSDPKSRK